MTRFFVAACLFFFSQLCGNVFAQATSESANTDPVDLDRARIESEKARLAARNRPGSRIPYRSEQYAPPASTPMPTTVVRPPPALAIPSSPPSLVSPCDAGGCFDSRANRYTGNSGGTYLDSTGKTCRQVGTTMQCF